MSNECSLKCAFCGISSSSLRLCSACRAIRYCSEEHQRKDWRAHKLHCTKVKNFKGRETKKTSLNVSENLPNTSDSELALDKSRINSIVPQQASYRLPPYPNGNSDQEPDLSTPIDSGMGVESSVSKGTVVPTPPPLYQLELSPNNQSVAKDLGPDWLSNVTLYVLGDLNKYGFCAVDNFFGSERAHKVFAEVAELHSLGIMTDGQVVSRQVQAHTRGMIRGDKIAWVSGTEEGCEAISELISTIDSVITNASMHKEAGKLSQYNITLRTRAMVACYPGSGSHYVKHVDNPNGDGRCVTAIYYVNENWKPQDGGVLRIYPEGFGRQVAHIEPIFDRMLFFWSDRRNPHEVLPSAATRFAITVWYLDKQERDEYRARCMKQLS